MSSTATAGCAESEASALESSLGWALGKVLRVYAAEATAALGDLPGGRRGYDVLSAAADATPCSQQALGRSVGVDRSVMTYLVDDLVSAGLVERQLDPDDRRARRIILTSTGRARIVALRGRLTAIDDHVLRDLPADERQLFRTALLRVALSADRASSTAAGSTG